MKISILHIALGLVALFFVSACSTSGQADDPSELLAPQITFGDQSVLISLKVGESLMLEPTVENGAGALYVWSLDGVEVCDQPTYTLLFDQNGTYYLSLLVTTAAGSDLVDLRIDVAPLSLPTISLSLPADGVVVLCGDEYLFEPTFGGDDVDDFECRWYLDEQVVCEQVSYTFAASLVGDYSLRIEASNADGSASPLEFSVAVVDQIPYWVEFVNSSLTYTDASRSTLVGRPLHLSVITRYFNDPRYSWMVDDCIIEGAESSKYIFEPSTAGNYSITVCVQEGDDPSTQALAEVAVWSRAGSQSDFARAPSAQSSAVQSAIYEFIPAPGQYIGDSAVGYSGDESTHAAAKEYAWQRLEQGQFVSLGGFGGYIVVGFDHSIVNADAQYDFAIYGNAFEGGSEPGIVWVMQDLNGNGEPDDEWYELRGSESGAELTLQEYAITYYRPSAPGQDVAWSDSEGASGSIQYYGAYHSQDSYFPAWIDQSSYTLRGTRLEPRNIFSGGVWDLQAYDWGYADNYGADQTTSGSSLDGEGQANYFNIENAVQPDLSAVELEHIDFIKVQVAVNTNSGILGELSTEVVKFVDLSIE